MAKLVALKSGSLPRGITAWQDKQVRDHAQIWRDRAIRLGAVLSWVGLWIAVVFGSPRVLGLTVAETSFEELVDRAETVAFVEVLSVRSQWSGEGTNRHISTTVTVQILEAAKGQSSGQLALDFIGGTVGDTTLSIPGMPQFQEGQREILFIAGNGTRLCPVIGYWHGRLKTWRNVDKERVALYDGQPLTDKAQMGRAHPRELAARGASETVRVGMTVGELLNLVRNHRK